MEPPWRPNANDINALSQEEIGTFDEVDVTLSDKEQDAWTKWDFSSKSVIQQELVELLMWEDRLGPLPIEEIKEEGCCTIL